MQKALLTVLIACVCLVPLAVHAEDLELELALPFRDNMILQRQINTPVWGQATPAATITVTFDGQSKTTTANQDGVWRLKLDPLKAVELRTPQSVPVGKPMTIVARLGEQSASVKLSNLVVGDVWLCAGQSNIAGKLKGSGTYQGQPADYPGFRHFTPTDEGGWTVCTPDREGAGEFKKTAFYFGRDVYLNARVPTGLVVCAVGGSNIESWLNQAPHETGKNYTNLVEPIVGMGIRGMVWYQGESNANKGAPYRPLLTSLITGWRDAWGQGAWPFYYVQLPGYGEPSNEMGDKRAGWPALRQDQLETLAIKNTGMAVTIDIGHKSVHPPNKVDTGRRLARLALHHSYGKEELVPTGPQYKGHEIKGNSVQVHFDYADAGLMLATKTGIDPPVPTSGQALQCLTIQGKDGVWHPAQGRIEGSALIVSSDKVPSPLALRYAYVPHPAGSLLYNKDGLPASPFETEVVK